jgi:hypothetical protein
MKHHFELTKEALHRAPFLQFPDYSKRFVIATDASNTRVGGVLYQPIDDENKITSSHLSSNHFWLLVFKCIRRFRLGTAISIFSNFLRSMILRSRFWRFLTDLEDPPRHSWFNHQTLVVSQNKHFYRVLRCRLHHPPIEFTISDFDIVYFIPINFRITQIHIFSNNSIERRPNLSPITLILF